MVNRPSADRRPAASWGARLAGAALAMASVVAPTAAQVDPFRPLDAEWPAPNEIRTGAGVPGPEYWQQEAHYVIDVTFNEAERSLTGELTARYVNNSPDALPFIWVHLDQNLFTDDGHFLAIQTNNFLTRRGQGITNGSMPLHQVRRLQSFDDNDYGMTLTTVSTADGTDLNHTINGTLMRVDLPEPLEPGAETQIRIAWSHHLVNTVALGVRSGWEELNDGVLLIGAAQWFPRIAAYTDVQGWHVDQFLGVGEFNQDWGDYTVNITVPGNYIVAATGSLANRTDILTPAQEERWQTARDAERPVMIVTTEEAAQNRRASGVSPRTWTFEAEEVRDFAWAASPSFKWDAMGVGQSEVMAMPTTPAFDTMAMSFYPDEGDPIWGLFATEAIAHTLEVFSAFSFPYPYPTAQAVNGPRTVGMEYPMISFDGVRPENVVINGERTYSAGAKWGLIGLIIHETGHFYFPMIVQSDERRWFWMDEGVTSFLESIANMTFDERFPESARSRRSVTGLARRDDRPLMSMSDSLTGVTRGNSYVKTTTALHVLRELVLGRETFDRAFRDYANAWMFKRPEPSDFFRAMETGAGEDLDWFWRAWFYTADHVDISIDDVRRFQLTAGDPRFEAPFNAAAQDEDQLYRSFDERNAEDGVVTRAERRTHLQDFYSTVEENLITNQQVRRFEARLNRLDRENEAALRRALDENNYIHQVTFTNHGGVISPLPLVFTFEDGSTETVTVPAYVWRREAGPTIEKLFVHDRRVVSVTLDPDHLTADADMENNTFPREIRDELMPVNTGGGGGRNLMREVLQERG